MHIKQVIKTGVLVCLLFFSYTQAQNTNPQHLNEATNILNMLSTGGYTVYVRHTHTERIRGDTDLTDCTKQRLLSEQGREEARAINLSFTQLDIPIGRLISTEYCRTKETTELAFSNSYDNDYEIITRADLFTQLTTLLGTPPAAGTNTFIVAHIGTLESAIGITTGNDIPFGEGDAIIFKPTAGGGYEIAKFIDVKAWSILLEAKNNLPKN